MEIAFSNRFESFYERACVYTRISNEICGKKECPCRRKSFADLLKSTIYYYAGNIKSSNISSKDEGGGDIRGLSRSFFTFSRDWLIRFIHRNKTICGNLDYQPIIPTQWDLMFIATMSLYNYYYIRLPDICTCAERLQEFDTRAKVVFVLCCISIVFGLPNSEKYRTVGRRKESEHKGGKDRKNDDGEKYERKNGNERGRRTSQGGNGSSGLEGSGEGSGNGEDSSDDDDEDDDEDGDDEDELPEEEDDEEEGDDEEEMDDTDNVSAMAEDDAEDTLNGGSVNEEQTHPVASTTSEIPSTGVSDCNEEDQSSLASITPVQPGEPVTLDGVIWKAVGGVLVVNINYRNKTYYGSLIDRSRYEWANPRHLDESQDECQLSNSARGAKGKKGKHKESVYLSPKLAGNGKRPSRFYRNKGKHGKETSTRSKGIRGSDTAEEGARTRRRSCTVKIPVSPCPSPTQYIECPERNCDKRYKHINGLRYHQAHAHLDNADGGDDKDSYDEDDGKERLSAHSKSSGSDDVKPLSHRKAKNQKSHSKVHVPVVEDKDNEKNDGKMVEPEENVDEHEEIVDVKMSETSDVVVEEKTGNECDVVNVKDEVVVMEHEADANIHEKLSEGDEKTDDKYGVSKIEADSLRMGEERSVGRAVKSNILEEAAKIIFDESVLSQELMVSTGIFSRMASSHAMLAAQNQPDYNKYVEYEPMDDYNEKIETTVDNKDLDVTIKEEVIDEGHAGEVKIPCDKKSEEAFKLDNAEMRLNEGNKSGEFAVEETHKSAKDEKSKLSPEKTPKSRKTDGTNVAKEQIKTSAAEIRALSEYSHFKLTTSNNSVSKSITIDMGLESKDMRKCGSVKETPRVERTGDKADGNLMTLMVPSVSSASFQLSCQSKTRSGYITSSRKPSVVTASTTWVPEVHHALLNKSPRGDVSGQEVLPDKPLVRTETADTTLKLTQDEEDKGEDERSKTAYSGKPARAVGVAHPFNAENKSDSEFALGIVGNITSDPVRVLYSKSSSPTLSLDHSHPDMTEVKKVRVEKTLEVPIGEVVPVTKTGRPSISTTSRSSVMVGNEIRQGFPVASEERVPQIITTRSSPSRDSHHPYIPSNRSSSWSRSSNRSPLRDLGPRTRTEAGQRFPHSETCTSRNPMRGSPVPEHRSSPVRGGYLTVDVDRRTPERDIAQRGFDPRRNSNSRGYDAHRGYDSKREFDSPRGMDHQRVVDKRIPFHNIDERLTAHKDVTRNSPAKDMSGRSPRRETPGTFHPKLGVGYRDLETGSPFSEGISRKRNDKSPTGDRRHPTSERSFRETRETSPSQIRERATSSPYRERSVNRSGAGELQRSDTGSPLLSGTTDSVSRGYRNKTEVIVSKDSGDMGSQYPRMSEQEAMMRNYEAIYQYQMAAAAAAGSHDEAAAREAMENCMMYLRMGVDPRLIQPYSTIFAAHGMPFVMASAKEMNQSKEERPNETPDEMNRKGSVLKTESVKGKLELSDVDTAPGKRYMERMSTSRERSEFDSIPVKRSKPNEIKDIHEIMDERDGGTMYWKTLENRALRQHVQHKMDAFNQLQTERSLKMKAEEKSIRLKPSASSNYKSKSTVVNESRSLLKRENKSFSKEDKRLASPGSTTDRSRNPESKSPLSSSSATPYMGYVPGTNLPANHALSKSYEQAMGLHGGYIVSPFPPGMMMAGPAFLPGAQLHNPVAARGTDSMRDLVQSSSLSADRARAGSEDSRETESRTETRGFHLKDDVGSTPRINPPSSSPPSENSKEKSGGWRRDTSSLPETQSLTANLAFRRVDMSGPSQFPPGFPGFMYPVGQGTFRPPYDHSFIPPQRK